MIGAILKAQWLSMRMRVGTRRTSAVFSLATGLVFYGFWAFLGWGAMLFFSEPENRRYFVDGLASALLFIMFYWQLAPVISASFGASLDLKKLLAYPIPRHKLYTVEVLLRTTTCAEMLILVAGCTVGLLRNPLYGLRASPFVLFGSLLFIATNILLSAGARSLLERFLLRSKLKEFVVLAIVLIGVLPQVLLAFNVKKAALIRFVPSFVVWPWASIARLMLGEPVLISAAMALLYFALAAWFSIWQFERSFNYDDSAWKKPERESNPDSVAEKLFGLPGRLLADPTGALVEKELRTLARIPRFRLVYAMSCFFGIILYLPQLRHPKPNSFFFQNALPIMALYGLLMLGQISYWNSFGFDRSAVQGYFSWPVRFRDVLIAKNISIGLLLLPQILLVSIFGAVVHLPSSPAKIAETICVMLVCSLYWFSMGNICSVRIPRAMNPDKMNQMSNKMQALTIWSAPFLLLPIGLAYWARSVFGNEWVFGCMLLVAAIIGAIFYYVGLDSAVAAAYTRREQILVELSKSDGPMSLT